MKAAEQDSPVELSIVLSNVVLTFAYVDKILKINVTIQMKATEPYFPVVSPVDNAVQCGSNF